MTTIGTLFTGFGGVDVGAIAAGLTPLWGVEYRADVAEVANRNLGGHVRVADVLACDPAEFPPVDVLHASPPCPNFSVAKANRSETKNDLLLAAKVAEFATVLRPRVFTLENVIAYRDSQSWHTIENALFDAGYWVSVEIINAADFGVPQTRKRMIVRAVLGCFVPYLPEPVPWVGWYTAIADLIPTLPEARLAPWQLARLPEALRGSVLVPGLLNDNSQDMTTRDGDAPCVTVTTSHNQRDMRAVLVEMQDGQRSEATSREAHEPVFTVTSSMAGRPSHMQAVLVDSGNTSRDATIIDAADCAMTVQSWHGRRPSHYPQAITGARVVAMTPRCLARFQSFPDSYELPEKRTLAAYGIGNAVPPLVYQKVIEGVLC